MLRPPRVNSILYKPTLTGDFCTNPNTLRCIIVRSVSIVTQISARLFLCQLLQFGGLVIGVLTPEHDA